MQTIREWISDWVGRVLPNGQAVSFAIMLVVGVTLVVTLGQILMPVLAAGVIAYLLEGLVKVGERKKLPRLLSVIVVFNLFMALLVFFVVALLPLLYQQAVQLIQQLPVWTNKVQLLVLQLPERYPHFINEAQLSELVRVVRQELLSYGQSMLSYSYTSLLSLISFVVYAILVPLLVFFFLKDKALIVNWFVQYLPRDRHLTTRVWREVDAQIGNYVRGKFFEVLLLLSTSFVTFTWMDLNYALLLGVLMGLSVIIPYVGATLVTFPVLLVAFFQWGVDDQFWWLVTAYTVIQVLDGVVLVPLLFSEAVNLHPVAIMVAILFFGGIGGFWGVFFAIPLATLVNAVLRVWPRLGEAPVETSLSRL
jgi:putative permease